MILVIVTMVVVWMALRRHRTSSFMILAAIGLASASLVTVGGSTAAVTEIPLGSEQALRVFSAAAFPFTIQQHRDYAMDTYHCAIVIGYPDGVSLVESPDKPDQSEFIHFDHYLFTAYLGALSLTAMAATLVALALLERKMTRVENRPTSSVYLGVAAIVGALLLAQAGHFALIQAPIHLAAAGFTFAIAMLFILVGLFCRI